MNPYARLVEAAQSLQHTDFLSREEPLTTAELAQFLAANNSHLDSARAALTRDCHFELEYSEESFEKHLDDIPPMRDLARAFRVELTAAERDGRLADAVRTGVNGLDLAGAVRRGGLIVDMLIANAISGISVDALRRLRHQLASDELEMLVGELQRVEVQREVFAVIAARDEDWERRFPPKEEFDPSKMEWPDPDGEDALDAETKQAFIELITHSVNRPREEQLQAYRDADNRDLAGLRLLAVESALLAYRLTHRVLPDRLNALGPKFPAGVPLDPYIDEPFRYHVAGENFLLYSVGPSRKDSGGRMGSWLEVTCGGADLFLDVSDCEVECGCGCGCPTGGRKIGLIAKLLDKARRLRKWFARSHRS